MLIFAQPLFLLALAGLVLPVLIHRISRARPIPWRFPSIARIRQTPLPRHGRRSLTDLLLLLLRMLLLALLILALAGPEWRSKKDASASGPAEQASVVLVLDTSSSMSGWGAMDQAREFLDALDIPSTGRFGWVAGSSDVVAEQVPESPQAALASLREFFRSNEPEASAGNPEQPIRRALQLLGETGPRRLILLSDFQSSDWSATLPHVPDGVDIGFQRVGTRGRNTNLSIHEVRTLPSENDRIRVVADLMNFSSEEKSITLELKIAEGATVRQVQLRPGIRTSVAFETASPEGSPVADLVLLDGDDPYPRDDRIRFTAAAPPPLNVIALNPGGPLAEGNEEIFFVDQALQIASTLEWVQYSVIPAGPDAINPETLSRIAAVVVPSSGASSDAVDWGSLKAYAGQGGMVLVTLGEDAVRVVQAMQQAGLPVGDYLGLAGRERFQRHFVGPIPESSRLARVFEGPASRDLFLMNIRQYGRLAPSPESSVLLQSESGDPLLLELPVGDGRLVVSTFPWNRMGSDFPLRPSFLPVVREIMGMALSGRRDLLADETTPIIPRSESVTTTLSQRELAARLRGGRAAGGAAAGLVDPGAQLQPGLALAPWLLLAAFLAWLAESLLAARLIRSSQPERKPA